MLIRNWRDAQPYVGHENAIIWSLLLREGREGTEGKKEPWHCMQRLTNITKHSLQPGKASDYHQHKGMEQLYYVLSGKGTVKIDGEDYPVREGDVVYLPPETMHTMINDSDDWVSHLIISCELDE